MSVSPTWTPRILDRLPAGLVPIALIAAFSWQCAMAQTGVAGARRDIHKNWAIKGASEVATAFAQSAGTEDRAGKPDSPPGHLSEMETQVSYAQANSLRFTHLTTNDG